MSVFYLIFFGSIGFLVSWGMIPLICRASNRFAFLNRDIQFHQTHAKPICRLGGIALAGGFLAVVGTAQILFSFSFGPTHSLILGCLAMFGVGLWDDINHVGAKVKLLAQIAIASAVYFGGVEISLLPNPFSADPIQLGQFGFVVTIFWLVALTNLINLADGIDGLAGGISFMLMCLLAYVALKGNSNLSGLIALGLGGALLGFLYYNFPPAKIYMGDGGAYFLGFLIGGLAITTSEKGTVAAALIAPMFALALPIVDTCYAILRRGITGLPFFRPDAKHIHHRLIHFGFSRTRTILTLYVISLLFLGMAFLVVWSQARLMPLMLGFLFLVVMISARSFGFVEDWTSIRRLVGESLQMRKETRYAMKWSALLEMEAERSPCLEELWDDFAQMTKKFGFCRVRAKVQGQERSWKTDESDPDADDPLRSVHEMNGGTSMRVTFEANPEAMTQKNFEHLCELAAEAWTKATTRWKETWNAPLSFSKEHSPPAEVGNTPIRRTRRTPAMPMATGRRTP